MNKQERNRLATKKWRCRHPTLKVDAALKRAHYSAARKRFHADPAQREKVAARQRAVALARDLKVLAVTVRVLRSRLEFAERNRSQALAAYHRHSTTINLRRRLPGLYRRAIRGPIREEQRRALRKNTLERAFRRVLGRAPNRAEQKLRKRLCSRFERVMKGRSSSRSALQLLGTSLVGARGHIEARFSPGMTWENHGYGKGFWNIDHVRPLASFQLSDPSQVREAFHFTNLQPLWHEDNMRKRDKFCSPAGLPPALGTGTSSCRWK